MIEPQKRNGSDSSMLKAIVCKVLPVGVRRAIRHCLMIRQYTQQAEPISYGYEVIEGKVPPELLQGWQDPAVPEKQHQAFLSVLRKMYEGRPREDFVALAAAVQMTQLENPLIIEAGCGSGWNSEVLTFLLKSPIRYIGVDISPAMISLGRRCCPDSKFLVGDATVLPFKDRVCDILLSGTVLMHLSGYREAIQESCRISRRWCIFHTVPIMQRRPTAFLQKFAYGSKVIEVIFNEEELLHILNINGLVVRQRFDSIPYSLEHILGESTRTHTYLCETM